MRILVTLAHFTYLLQLHSSQYIGIQLYTEAHKRQVTQVSTETYKISDPLDISPPTRPSSIV